MKKLCSIGLSALLMFGVGTAAMATTMETTGELDVNYHGHHWTGEKSNYTIMEAGLKNHISMNDTVSGDLNFWMDSNGVVHNFKVDAAYLTYKFGTSSLKIGYDEFAVDGSLYVLNDFTKGLVAGKVKPAVQLLGTVPLGSAFEFKGGYFHNTGGNFNESTADYNGLMGDDGRNIVVLKGSYNSGKLSANLTYMLLSKCVWDATDPADEYVIDAGYKIGDKYKVYAAYIGANRTRSFDNNWQNPNNWTDYTPDQTDNFAILGCSASLGKLWLAAEYAFLTPDKDETYIWINEEYGSGRAHNWADNPPFGFKVSYWFGNNTTLEYYRAANTGNYNDKDRLRLQVKF